MTFIYYIIHFFTGCREFEEYKGASVCKKCGRIYFHFYQY